MWLQQLLLVKVLQGHLQVAYLLVEVVPHHLEVALLLNQLQVALLLLELMRQDQFLSVIRQYQFLSMLPEKTVRLQELNCDLPIHPIIVGVATRRFILHSYLDHRCQT
jgi:hypothetical protein